MAHGMTQAEEIAARARQERDRLLAACRAITNVNVGLNGRRVGIDELHSAVTRIDQILVGVSDLIYQEVSHD